MGTQSPWQKQSSLPAHRGLQPFFTKIVLFRAYEKLEEEKRQMEEASIRGKDGQDTIEALEKELDSTRVRVCDSFVSSCSQLTLPYRAGVILVTSLEAEPLSNTCTGGNRVQPAMNARVGH